MIVGSPANYRQLGKMSAVDVCAVDHAYANTRVHHYAWDDFAASFITLIANHASQERISEIGDFLFGQSVFSDGAYDLLLSQPSFLIIFWIGVILSVLSVAGAIVMLFPCARNWNTRNISSKTMAITGTALAVVSFAFIVTGIVLYSISHFEQGYRRDAQPMDAVKKNIDSFMTTQTQNACFARSAFDPILGQNSEIPNSIALNFIVKTGLLQMSQVDCAELSIQFSDNLDDVLAIIDHLQEALDNSEGINDDDDAKSQVQEAIEKYTQIRKDLTTNELPRQITEYGQAVIDYNATIQDQLIDMTDATWPDSVTNYAADEIGRQYSAANVAIGNATLAMYNVSSRIDVAASQIGYALDGASEVVDSQWIYYRWFLFAPLIFALIASIIALGFGFYYSCTKSREPIKGVGCGLLVLGIVVLALTSVVMVPAIVGMTFGYATQASFDPYFYDYNLKGLHISTQILPNNSIHGMNGLVITSFADVMVTCRKENTPFFNAVVGKDGDVINVAAIEQAVNVTFLSDTFEHTLGVEIKKTLPKDQQADVYNFLSGIKNPADFLDAAQKADPTRINDILERDMEWQSNLQPYLDDFLDAYDYSSENRHGVVYHYTDLTDLTTIKIILKDEMDDLLEDLSSSMKPAAKSLHDDLYKNGESCGNLYQSYADAGDLATVGMAGQVQGMWAAAGLVALFFIPLAISLLCIGNAFRHGEEAGNIHDGRQYYDAHSPAPAVVHPAPAKAPAVAHTPAPLVVPNAVVAVPPSVAPRRAEPLPPAVPIRSTSYQQPRSPQPQQQQQWQPVYLPPQPVSNFVDPLAYPQTPSAHAAPASYAGGPANGFYGQPTSRH